MTTEVVSQHRAKPVEIVREAQKPIRWIRIGTRISAGLLVFAPLWISIF